MKIVAAIDRETFLVEATENELANIMGYPYRMSCPDQIKPDRVGREVAVSEIYSAFREVGSIAAILQESLKRHSSMVKSLERVTASILPIAKSIEGKCPK